LIVTTWPTAALAQSSGPDYVTSRPKSGAFVHRAPDSVWIRFSEDLGDSSAMQVIDECGQRVDSGVTQISGTDMETELVEKPSGEYTVTYQATGAEEGSGTTEESFTFEVHLGPSCDPTPEYEASKPADGSEVHRAPDAVWMRFSEPLGPSSSIRVVDECGRRVDTGTTRVSGDEMQTALSLKPSGHYTATYRAVAEDGSKTTSGDISFHVHLGPSCNGNDHDGNGNHDGNGHDGKGDHDRGGGHDAGAAHGPQDPGAGTHTEGHEPSEHATADAGHTTEDGSTHSDGAHAGAEGHAKDGKHGHHSGGHESAAPLLEDPSLNDSPTTAIAAPDDDASSNGGIAAIAPTATALLGALAVALGLGLVGGLFLRSYATS
jgi:methionine-rich copper-binding protein CopC